MKTLIAEDEAELGNATVHYIESDGKTVNFYQWDSIDNNLEPVPTETAFKKMSISNYQMADELYHNGGLQLKNLHL